MFKQIQRFTTSPKLKKVFAVCMCLLLGCTALAPACFAADTVATTEMTPASAAGEVFSVVSEKLNFTTILSVWAVAIPAVFGLFLCLWGARKVVRMVMAAFKKGRVGI